MELGYDAVLLNTAVAKAADPARMAEAFAVGDQFWAPWLRSRPDATARHGRPFDARRRYAFLRSRLSFAWALAKTKLARFYPIVPDVGWLARIVPLGIKLVQLRIKDGTPC